MQNYFLLFKLPISFEINLKDLDDRLKVLQQQLHPDMHSQNSIQKAALQKYSAQVNLAYNCLKDPISRLEHILKLYKVDLNLDSVSSADPQFLQQQFEFNEKLEEIGDIVQAKDLREIVGQELDLIYQNILSILDKHGNIESDLTNSDKNTLSLLFKRAQFYNKLINDIDELF